MTILPGVDPDAFPSEFLSALSWDTPRGTLRVYSRASADFILGQTVDPGFGVLFRPSRYQEELVHVAQHPEGNVFVAVAEPGIVVGYLLAERPVPVAWQRRVARNRWSDSPAIVELGAMEVSANYRRLGIAEHLIEALVNFPEYQDKIIIGTILRRYWDLKGSGMNAWQYRTALVRLLGDFGFEVFTSDDPRVLGEPTDALLARFGPDVAPEHVDQFHRLLVYSTPSHA